MSSHMILSQGAVSEHLARALARARARARGRGCIQASEAPGPR